MCIKWRQGACTGKPPTKKSPTHLANAALHDEGSFDPDGSDRSLTLTPRLRKGAIIMARCAGGIRTFQIDYTCEAQLTGTPLTFGRHGETHRGSVSGPSQTIDITEVMHFLPGDGERRRISQGEGPNLNGLPTVCRGICVHPHNHYRHIRIDRR